MFLEVNKDTLPVGNGTRAYDNFWLLTEVKIVFLLCDTTSRVSQGTVLTEAQRDLQRG